MKDLAYFPVMYIFPLPGPRINIPFSRNSGQYICTEIKQTKKKVCSLGLTTFTTNVWLWSPGQPDKKMSVVQLKTILTKRKTRAFFCLILSVIWWHYSFCQWIQRSVKDFMNDEISTCHWSGDIIGWLNITAAENLRTSTPMC